MIVMRPRDVNTMPCFVTHRVANDWTRRRSDSRVSLRQTALPREKTSRIGPASGLPYCAPSRCRRSRPTSKPRPSRQPRGRLRASSSNSGRARCCWAKRRCRPARNRRPVRARSACGSGWRSSAARRSPITRRWYWPPGLTSAELAQRLAQEGDVEYAVPDERRHIVAAPNDPLYADGVPGNGPAVGQWYLRAPTGVITSSIDVEPAWEVTIGNPERCRRGRRHRRALRASGSARRVGDGGNLLPGYDMISDPVVANDGDGRDADASDPGDWVTAGGALAGRRPVLSVHRFAPRPAHGTARRSPD